ncbi:MAG: glycogen/starch synthase, partial [Myxococcales bacterium]|nr:glycogen/starch synthase [Myxococcales bacterium]
MEIFFVTGELAPLSGSGPIGRLCGALPKALRGLDHQLTIFSPLYKQVDPGALSLARRLSKLEVKRGDRTYACELYDGRSPAGVNLVFIGHEELFGPIESILEGDDPGAHALRIGVFAEAACLAAESRERPPEIVHGHDLLGAAFVSAMGQREALSALPSVLTLYDRPTHARFESAHLEALGLPEAALRCGDHLDVLAAGTRRAGRVTAVSRGLAASLLEPGSGHGLEEVIGALPIPIEGVPDGIDVSVWNPITDPHLSHRFDPEDLRGKRHAKTEIQRSLELPIRPEVPLIFAHGGADPADGLDRLAEILPEILQNDVQIVVQAIDESESVETMEECGARFDERLRV